METEIEKTEYYKTVLTKAIDSVGNTIDEDDILKCQIAIWSDDFKEQNEELAMLYTVADAAEKKMLAAGDLVRSEFKITEVTSHEYAAIMAVIKEKKKNTPGGVFSSRVIAKMDQYARAHNEWAVSCKQLGKPLALIKIISACLEKYKNKE